MFLSVGALSIISAAPGNISFQHIYLPTFPTIGALPPDLLAMGKFNHIPELTDASIFQTWKTQIILALGREGVYNHVSEGTDPTDFVEFASELLVPAKPGAPTTVERKLIQEWLKEDVIAKDIICHHLSPAILQLIPQGRSSTARDAWKLLHSHFDHIDLGSQYLVREKILGLQMKDAKDAQRYLGEHDTLCRDLIQMGVTYSNSKAVFNLLKGLPRTGTWPAFKLFLQTSISTSTSLTSANGTVTTSASSSSVSQLLSTTGTTFESVSVRIAAEAHCLVLEASVVPALGSEYLANTASITTSLLLGSINPATSLWCTKNNPSGTFCDTPLGDGTICGAISHDWTHYFKPGGGMAGQRPAHWPPEGGDRSHSASTLVSGSSGSAGPTAPTMLSAASASSPVVAAAVLDSSDSWVTRDYDLVLVHLFLFFLFRVQHFVVMGAFHIFPVSLWHGGDHRDHGVFTSMVLHTLHCLISHELATCPSHSRISWTHCIFFTFPSCPYGLSSRSRGFLLHLLSLSHQALDLILLHQWDHVFGHGGDIMSFSRFLCLSRRHRFIAPSRISWTHYVLKGCHYIRISSHETCVSFVVLLCSLPCPVEGACWKSMVTCSFSLLYFRVYHCLALSCCFQH